MRMSKNPSNYKKAFSLLEMSFVILIVSLLIAGVTKSVEIISKSKLANARALTKNSPVLAIDDLLIWYETSLESSFLVTEREDETSVSIWYDNALYGGKKINATQATADNQPTFYEDVLNGGIPALRFDGNDYLNFDANGIVGSEYIIFIVEQRRIANSAHCPMIGGNATSTYQNLHITYAGNTILRFAHYGADTNLDVVVEGYTNPRPKIHTFMFSQDDGKEYWLNGGSVVDESVTGSNQNTALTSFNGAAIGRYQNSYFNGDISEIIIFTRKLLEREKTAIEDYLSKKYNIKIE